jgi:hypothetical protein
MCSAQHGRMLRFESVTAVPFVESHWAVVATTNDRRGGNIPFHPADPDDRDIESSQSCDSWMRPPNARMKSTSLKFRRSGAG